MGLLHVEDARRRCNDEFDDDLADVTSFHKGLQGWPRLFIYQSFSGDILPTSRGFRLQL